MFSNVTLKDATDHYSMAYVNGLLSGGPEADARKLEHSGAKKFAKKIENALSQAKYQTTMRNNVANLQEDEAAVFNALDRLVLLTPRSEKDVGDIRFAIARGLMVLDEFNNWKAPDMQPGEISFENFEEVVEDQQLVNEGEYKVNGVYSDVLGPYNAIDNYWNAELAKVKQPVRTIDANSDEAAQMVAELDANRAARDFKAYGDNPIYDHGNGERSIIPPCEDGVIHSESLLNDSGTGPSKYAQSIGRGFTPWSAEVTKEERKGKTPAEIEALRDAKTAKVMPKRWAKRTGVSLLWVEGKAVDANGVEHYSYPHAGKWVRVQNGGA